MHVALLYIDEKLFIMTVYNGNFVVVNKTGFNFTNCIVTHVADGQAVATAIVGNLPGNGTQSFSTAFKTQSNSKDYWSVSFLNEDNALCTGMESCGFEKEDDDCTVSISLGSSSFDVIMPNSSSCMDNDYDQA
jgi:hypothetical protein